MKKIIVLGAGAIGSAFAALLSEHYDVLLVGRKPHVEEIKKRGLHITGIINKTVHLKTATEINTIDPNTILLLTVKTQQTKDAILGIQNKIKNDTVIVCIQNGLGSEEIVKSLTSCKVVRAVTLLSAIFLKEGEVTVTAMAPTYIPTKEKELAQLFTPTDIPILKAANIKKKIWEKLAINCVTNGLGSVLRVRTNLLQSPYLQETKKAIVNECIAVAKKDGVTLPKSLLEMINKIISTSTNINSTLQDLMKHKTTEIDFLNGAVVQLGETYHIDTPVNRTIWNLIKASENI